MGKKKKNKNHNHRAETSKSLATTKKPSINFQLRDILCILAALLFAGSWVYNNQVGEIPMKVMGIIYIAIVLLLGVYFFISPKFQYTWKRWDKHTKIYLAILILGDILALVTYDVMQNYIYMAIFVVVNLVYYVLFLRNRASDDNLKAEDKPAK